VVPEHFKKSLMKGTEIPKDLFKACSGPIVGFWGALSSWIDFSLIEFALDSRPNYNFVFLGTFTTAIPKLPVSKNAFYLGPKDYESLPDYARWFDAAIIPFRIKPVTLAADPVKVYEYMASGLPVVSTYLPQLEGIADIKLSRSPEEFVSNLDWAVYCGKKPELIETRLEFARQNTWEMRARTVAEIIKEVVLNG
jgi:glycosyltransferase involved in cell wall biosynthesis